jgi:hypothetical protein
VTWPHTYTGRDYGSHARQAQETAELRGMHEPCADPGWVAPLLTFPAEVMDRASTYPIDGDAA